MLMALAALTAWTRLRASRPPRSTLAISLALFLIPLLALCGATILTLRSETAVRALSG